MNNNHSCVSFIVSLNAVPRTTWQASYSQALGFFPQLRLGASWRYQSRTQNLLDSGVLITQDSYSLFSAFAEWQLARSFSLTLNLDNLTDEKYLTSLYYPSYYAAPRSASLKLRFRG